MKTAVCFTGIGRSLFALKDHYVLKNLYTALVACWDDADVYYVLGKTDNSDKILEVLSAIPRATIVIAPQGDIDLSGVTFDEGGWAGKETKPSAQSLSKFMNKRKILGEYLKNSGKKYDRVIISRDDVIYQKPISEEVKDLDLSKLWIPNWGHWCGGYNDRFVVSNQENIFKYCEVWDHRYEVNKIHVESFYRYCLDKYVGEENIGTFFTDIRRIRPSGTMEISDSNVAIQAPASANNQNWKRFLNSET